MDKIENDPKWQSTVCCDLTLEKDAKLLDDSLATGKRKPYKTICGHCGSTDPDHARKVSAEALAHYILTCEA